MQGRKERHPNTEILRRDLGFILWDGMGYTLMVGVAELQIAYFVLTLGLGPIAAGLISTVPVLMGAIGQMFVVRSLHRIGSYSRFMGKFAFLQAAMYLPLIALALGWPWLKPWIAERGLMWLATLLVFSIWAVYWAVGLAVGPVWQTVVGTIVPASIRANYFARRTRWLQLATLVGLLLAGVTLKSAETTTPNQSGHDPVLLAFAAVFGLAFVARAISAWYLSRYSEPEHAPHQERNVSLRQFAGRFRHGSDGRFLAYILGAGAAFSISQPFFHPYMLDIVGLGKASMMPGQAWAGSAYAWFLAATYLGRVIAAPTLGMVAKRHGVRPIFIAGALGIVPVSLFWFVSDNLWVLLLTQVLAGALWAAFELAFFLMSYEAIDERERTSVFTNYTLANEFAKTGGSLMGAGVLEAMSKSREAYAAVFWISTAARALVLWLAWRALRSPTPRVRETTPPDSGLMGTPEPPQVE